MTTIRIINDHQPRSRWPVAVRQATFLLFLFGPGVALDIAAMQWAGFVFTLIAGVALLVKFGKDAEALTPDEARARIDQIEKSNR